MTKICGACGVEKDIEAFYAHPRTRDRRFKDCAMCFRAYRKTLYLSPGRTATDTVDKKISRKNDLPFKARESDRWTSVR